MSEIFVTDTDGKTESLTIEVGVSLMEHLTNAGYDAVQAICGGCCSCATCHVHIDGTAGVLPPIEENEEMLLEMADEYDPEKSRLSCQVELDDGHNGLKVSLLAGDF